MLIGERKGFLGEVHRERKGLDSSLSSLQDELCLVTVSSQQQGLLALTRVLLDGRLQGKEWGELKGLDFPVNWTQCHWESQWGAPLKCPAFLLSTLRSCSSFPHPLHSYVFCSMNKYYVVWCSLLFDMKKGNSLGWKRRGRETPFFTQCIKHGYTDLNSQKSNKTVKIMIKQLVGWQLCSTREHWRQAPVLQQDNIVEHMVPLQASCWTRWPPFVWGTLPALGLW